MNKEKCPLQNKCMASNIVYEAQITCNGQNRRYLGICESSFKLRYANHKKSFSHEKYKHETELSKEYWRLKEAGSSPIVKWRIKKVCKPFNQVTKRCDLCLSEKFFILDHDGDNLLNKRNELVSKCRHRNKYLLSRH